jgi:DNA-binding transcriptional MerR regulator
MTEEKGMELRHYSLQEVARQFGLNASTLRFWSKEFDGITPRKTLHGRCYYLEEDIRRIRLIHHLVKERGMTLPGARQRLRDNRDDTVHEEAIVSQLKDIRDELRSLADAMSAYDPHLEPLGSDE